MKNSEEVEGMLKRVETELEALQQEAVPDYSEQGMRIERERQRNVDLLQGSSNALRWVLDRID